ncbi:MAG TPA: NAD-dependent succinate-semialdehyde dehydrogenase [Bryobacteraceae bacterium]|nr:NAD-dependent succinate-semialdehyde dehydrogenase [Bryobacteraceae bacterium]
METATKSQQQITYTYQQWIGDGWRDASNDATWDVLNPATEEVIRTVPFGNAKDCALAIEAAYRAFPRWSQKTAYERAALLRTAADLMRQRSADLGRTTVLESGKPLIQAKGEWGVAADLFDWFAEEAKRAYGRVVPARNPAKRQIVIKQPLGVVGLITAWNFPAYNVARAAAAALAAGCTVVVRPSEYTPLTAMEMVNILVESGLSNGEVNLINGEPESMGQEMLRNSKCAKIHFTGSQRVGKLLMDGASATVKRLSLELGGNAPVLVFPDVDLEQVTASAVTAKFRNGGQVCISPQRFFVHDAVADKFADCATSLVSKLRLGNGLEPDSSIGPLINSRQRDRVEEMVITAQTDGARVCIGGRRPADRPRGYFYEPTVITQVPPATPLFQNEIFGPVMPIARFQDADEAIEKANSTRYGLAAYVWTNDLRTAMRAAERLEFGMVGVNEWTPQSTEVPFAGWKESGLGREAGAEGLEEYLETKLVAFGGIG